MSAIDPTKPTTGEATTASVRDNFQAAKDEIEALDAGKANAAALAAHEADQANPHVVTLAQVGGSHVAKSSALVVDPLPTSATSTLPHGLGATPDFYTMEIECKTANANYAVGDKVQLPYGANWANAAPAYTVMMDATNVVVISFSQPPNILNKTTRVSANLTAANWKLRLYAYRIT